MGSSSKYTSKFLYSALAKFTFAFCPPLKVIPRSPTWVRSESGSDSDHQPKHKLWLLFRTMLCCMRNREGCYLEWFPFAATILGAQVRNLAKILMFSHFPSAYPFRQLLPTVSWFSLLPLSRKRWGGGGGAGGYVGGGVCWMLDTLRGYIGGREYVGGGGG